MSIHKYIILLVFFALSPVVGCFAQYQTKWYQTLEDSEIVFANGIRAELKKGSKITIPVYFNGPEVNTILSGEARFQVLSGCHLVVEFNQVIIKATGASFSVTEAKGTIEVTALEGKISIWANREQMVLQFQRAVYDVYAKQVSIMTRRLKELNGI